MKTVDDVREFLKDAIDEMACYIEDENNGYSDLERHDCTVAKEAYEHVLDALCGQRETFTAFIYEDDGITAADLSTYDDKEEAVTFAKNRNWDEVVNDLTGEVIWRR